MSVKVLAAYTLSKEEKKESSLLLLSIQQGSNIR